MPGDRYREHEHVQELLGAFALNAVSTIEAREVEVHLDQCDECPNELDIYRSTVALLGPPPTAPPAGVWERIEARLAESPSRPQGLLHQISEGTHHRPVRSAGLRRIAQVAGAIAAAVLFVLGGVAIGERKESTATLQQVAEAARRSPGVRIVTLGGGDGRLVGEVVLTADGRGYLVSTNLPTLAADRTYQLWVLRGERVVSAGVLGSRPGTAGFMAAGDLQALAVSEEPAGGAIAPGSAPLLTGAVPA